MECSYERGLKEQNRKITMQIKKEKERRKTHQSIHRKGKKKKTQRERKHTLLEKWK